ncbi:hypothetical protein [Nocardioides jiangxiensis]|uniref:Uncharacterized protein n=1 Tax=Nocardioides jiangxiensis TaxID=3064524 RepID=A0ABT9B297_9ACTN|nr:hypothetical protein [Nocardioides sp. WY-20]MDO7868515.1 hypothetical protein [Nocardioides sp. WY-20]
MGTESLAPTVDDEATGGAATTLVTLAVLGYVVGGIFWMEAAGAEPTSTLTPLSVVQFLWAILFWPLHLVGIA